MNDTILLLKVRVLIYFRSLYFVIFLADYLNNKGCPYASNTTSVQLRNEGGGGLVLLQDTQLIETLAHFSRERIPER